jgi:hypothetical protein
MKQKQEKNVTPINKPQKYAVEIIMTAPGKGDVLINGKTTPVYAFKFEGGVGKPNMLTLAIPVDAPVRIKSKETQVKEAKVGQGKMDNNEG